MKKQQLTLVFLQILATSLLLIVEASAGSIEFIKTNIKPTEEKDIEIKTAQEKDVFPNLLSFATHLYQ
jgi:hypothetical protein